MKNIRRFLERHRDIGIGAEPHLIALDIGHQAERDVMMMPLMAPLTAVLLGQLDAVARHMVDGADMHAIGADDFHMFLDRACVGHANNSFVTVAAHERTGGALVASEMRA